MFREVMGLPAHALVIHAAVVFVPLLAVLAIGYGVLPAWRGRLGWAAAILAVLAPVTVFVAKESGEELEHILAEKNYGAEILKQVEVHSGYADQLFWWTVGLAVATALLLFATSRHPRAAALPGWVGTVLTGLVVVLGVLAVIYVYLTGDSGAQAVWKGVV
ncbi:DUF2231 domain-containing protein [Micromonospora zhanjiangensis]|uniref:DUF2231 domain-containing protein n=1 Tax=Micromonospora zhanjiangensis TaxID=1522057 RepID=A0ABV8KF98_9ACTN